MIDPQQRQLLCELVDELRVRGVAVCHIENDGLKIQLHINPVDSLDQLGKTVRERLVNDPNTPPEIRVELKRKQDEEDLQDIEGAG